MCNNQDKLQSFRQQRERLIRMLSEASEVTKCLNMTSSSECLIKLCKKVTDDSFKILIVGTFKNGKSTLINSLLGGEILPAQVLPCTAVINELKYGEDKKAIIYFKNPLPAQLPQSIPTKAREHMNRYANQNIPPLEIDCEEINDYVVIPFTADVRETLLESPYEKVDVFWPLDMLKEGVEIVDSPGLNEANTRTKVTMDYLNQADVILFVLTADHLCSQSEMLFIVQNLEENGFSDTFFVVNKFDIIPEGQRNNVKLFTQSHLSQYSSVDIFYLSASEALASKIEGNEDEYEKSGLKELEDKLYEFLNNERGRVKLTQPSRELKRILMNEALGKSIPTQIAMLNESLDEVRHRYELAQPRLANLQTEKLQIINKLTTRITQSSIYFRRAVISNSREIADSIPVWIDEYTPNARLGAIPTRNNIASVVNEICDFVNNKIEEHQSKWKSDVLIPLFKERTQFIFDSIEHDLETLYQGIDELSVTISGNADISLEPIPVWQRVAGFAGGLLLGCPDVALAGGVAGLTQDLLKTLALVIGTESVLLILGATNPVILIGGVIAALAGGNFAGNTLMNSIKRRMTEQMVNEISNNTNDNSETIAESITSKMMTIVDDVSSAIDSEIAQTKQQVEAIINEMNLGVNSVETRKQEINSCKTRIMNISEDLDRLIFELLDNM